MNNTQTTKARKTRDWIIPLLLSIAINGFLAGWVISQKNHKTPEMHEIVMPSAPSQAFTSEPRRLVFNLPPARRRQVMTTAFKKLKLQQGQHPRQIFKQLRRAKTDMRVLLRANTLDMDAIEKSLAEIRALNQQLAVSGDALMLEVLAQLTPEERKKALVAMHDKKRKARKERHRP